MPTTRKSARLSSGAGAGGKQSTLSFNHRVTKNTVSSAKSAKNNLVKPLTKDLPGSTVTDDEKSQPTSPAVETTPPAATTPPAPQEETEAERRAAQISDRAIERYWGKIEAGRMAKAVHRKHTEDLTTGEKVLRYFDVSSQYGPCIGITRLKRWQRADRLGLNPPIEVLAALIKEEEAQEQGRGSQKAHMDELMNSTAVGAA